MLFAVLALGTLVGCKDACEKAADDMAAKLEECGLTAEEGTGGGDAAECTDEAAAAAECLAGCMEAAPCEVILGTGTDLEAITSYGECALGCLDTGATAS